MEKRNSTFIMSSPNRKTKGNPVMLRGGNCTLLAQEEPCLSSNILYLNAGGRVWFRPCVRDVSGTFQPPKSVDGLQRIPELPWSLLGSTQMLNGPSGIRGSSQPEMGNLIKDSNCCPSAVLPPRSPHGNSGPRAALVTGPRRPSADQAPPTSSITLRTCKLLFIPTSHVLLKMWVYHK